jgi:hypothetical protein
MAWDAVIQLSDALSFVLVTPEFLGEQRLSDLRNRLHGAARRLLKHSPGDDEASLGNLAGPLILGIIYLIDPMLNLG